MANEKIIIKNSKFIPGITEGGAPSGDVIVSDGLIEAIVPCGTADVEGSIFDMKGATLLPGLIDAHVHLYMAGSADQCANMYPGDRVFECYRYAKLFLDHGFTTLRDVGDTEEYPSVHLGRAIDSGLIEGPRIIPSGLTLTPYQPGSDISIWKYATCEVNGPMDVRLRARQNFQRGAQFIKLYGSGSMVCPGAIPGRRIMFDDEIRAGVETAEMRGTYVAIHAHGAEAVEQAFRCGVRTVEHATLIDPQTTDYILTLERTVGIVPTLTVFNQVLDPNWDYPGAEIYAKQARDMFGTCLKSMRYAYEKGALIGFGTDLFMDELMKHPFGEFKIRHEEFDFDGVDILKQATINNAVLIGKDDVLGSITKGKYADLIVVDGDPIEDFSVMYKKPLHVMKGGKWVR